MRASAKVFYALAILTTATLTACGNPPPAYGGDDSSLCSDPNRADSACAKLEITSFTVAGEPTTTSVTFDFDTLNDQSVTVRDRDTMQQERVKIDELESYLASKLGF